jgi:tRNA synthetases class I (E and Q), anti-codon binding domain
LLKKAKLEEGDKLEDFLNRDSKYVTAGIADAGIKSLDIGCYVQF